MQPEAIVWPDRGNIGAVAHQPLRLFVLAPLAFAQPPQSLGTSDPYGPLFVLCKGPCAGIEFCGLIDVAEDSGRGRPVIAENAARGRNP
jgi:hypothetical protein